MSQLSRPRARRSPGFTTVEVLLALSLTAIALFTIAALSRRTLAQGDDGEARYRGAALAGRTIDSLIGARCDSLVAGSDSVPGASVSWTITSVGIVRQVHAELQFTTRGTTRTASYEEAIPCPHP